MQQVSNNLLGQATTVGKQLLSATDAAAAKTALGLSTVATSGAYADLSGKPALANVATSGAYSDLSGTPSLAPVATSGSYTDLSDKPAGGGGVTFAQTKIVGVDANTIQGCIDLVTNATAQNQTQILIPPGFYTENLTLKRCVSLAATGQNNGQVTTIRIVGQHTLAGGATAGDNIIQFAGLRFDNTHATTPTFTFSAQSGVPLLVHFDSCMVGSSNAATTSVGMLIGTDVSVRCNDVKSLANATAGSGGTHFDINGGTLYGTNLSTEYGTRAILMRGTPTAYRPYCELKNCDLRTWGANLIEIQSTTALLTAGWCSFENTNSTGSGIVLAGAVTSGAVAGIFNCAFTITSGASNYVVTGDAGCAYYALGNSYSNATYAPYETKIGANVLQLTYAGGPIAFADGTSISSGFLTGSKTHDFPSLAANSTSATTVTCTGATVGMFALASLSTNSNGITLVANVTASNTVTVRAINNTGATVDLASGTLKVRVFS